MADILLEKSAGYSLRRMRLINIHNFVDESIDIRGSLFLIGNNGTGKTTLLDALQLGLTGGQQLTYNAATIFGPRSSAGRTLAGVLLRHDFESGTIGREGGAIGYVALELRSEQSDDVLTIGVGAFVEGLDQRPETWGFVIDEPLSRLTLTTRVDPHDAAAGERPVDKRELCDILGDAHVYDIGRYRTQVANRLFGGRENFERVADLLKASKSYKELVVKARDFEGLFAYLLPAPAHQVFQDIESTLKSLDTIEADLRALRQERGLLAEAMDVVTRIGASREAIARLRYLLAKDAFDNADREGTRIARDIQKNEQAIADAHGRLETVLPQLERAREVLNEIRIGEPGRLLEEQSRLERDIRRSEEELSARSTEREAEATRRRNASREKRQAIAAFEDALREQLSILEHIAWPEMPEGVTPDAAQKYAQELLAAYRSIEVEAALDITPLKSLRGQLQQETEHLITHVRDAYSPHILACAELERTRNALCERTIGAGVAVEFLPDVPGYAEFAAELDSKHIEWAPLYRLVDFVPKTSAALMDVIESYIGERLLGTVFVTPERCAEVAEIARARYPGVTVADTSALSSGKTPRIVRESLCAYLTTENAPLAKRFLAVNFGDVTISDARQDSTAGAWVTPEGIAYAGRATWRLHQPARGLLGMMRRRKAVETHQKEREKRLAEIDEQLAAHNDTLSSLRGVESALLEIRSDIEDRVMPWLIAHRHGQVASAGAHDTDAAAREKRLRTQESRIEKQIEQLRVQLSTLRGDERGQTTGDIRKKIDVTKKQVMQLERERDRYQELSARHKERVEIARKEHAALETRRAELEEMYIARRNILSDMLPERERTNVDEYVTRVMGHVRGGVAELTRQLRENERVIDREIGSLIGISEASNQSHGGLVHHALLWTKYAFSYDEEANILRDQEGVDATQLYARLNAEVESLESVVSERRRKLLEKTILGDLANQYTRDLYRLRESLSAVNHMLSGLTFGRTRYTFTQKIKPEYRQVYGIVRRAGAIDAESQTQLKTFFESRLEQLRIQPDGTLPPFLDYRHWFDYHLHVQRTDGESGVELTNDIRRLGSGGEQAVPNYLLIMAMSALLYNQIGSRVRLLLFDEAFYGIDAARRDELLRFAARLGITLCLATPAMDGVTEAMRESTTLLLEKDEKNAIYIGNFAWESDEGTQMDIFSSPEEASTHEAHITIEADRAAEEES